VVYVSARTANPGKTKCWALPAKLRFLDGCIDVDRAQRRGARGPVAITGRPANRGIRRQNREASSRRGSAAVTGRP